MKTSTIKAITIEIDVSFTDFVDKFVKDHPDYEYLNTSLVQEYKKDNYSGQDIPFTKRRIIFRKRDKFNNDNN